MKKCRKILLILMAAVFTFALFALTACGESGEQKITVSPTSVTVEEGKTATVTATLTGISGDVTWTVDDDTIATVEASAATTKAATITGVAEGTAVVTATAGGKSATVNVTVTEAQQAPGGNEDEASVTLNKTTLSLVEGEDDTITATISNSEVQTVTWSIVSGDTYIDITENGNTVTVEAVAEGTATVRAAIDATTYADCTITVSKAPVTLTLDMDSVELDLDEEEITATVTATVENNEGKVTWTIVNENVATIEPSQDGLTCTVTAQKVGVTTLTASVDDGAAFKTIDVIVNGTPDMEGVVFEFENVEGSLNLTTLDQKLIEVKLEGLVGVPAWSVDDNTVIELSAETGTAVTVTALKKGDAVLTVAVDVLGYNRALPLNIHVEDPTTITFNKTEINLVNDAQGHNSETLTATVTGPTELVTWSIVDGSDDCITLSGTDTNTITITAKAVGRATIMAKIDDVEETIEVTVAAPVTLTIDHDTLELTVGGADGTITATVTGTQDTISYRITDGAAYITVTQNGNVLTVTAVAEGTATITISVGDQELTCTVTVSEPASLPEWTFTNTFAGNEADGTIWHQGEHGSITSDMSVEMVVKVNGSVVNPIESSVLNGVVKVHIFGSRFDRVEITFTFKDAGGAAIATASYSYEPEDELVLDEEEVSIQVDNTKEVSILTFNGSNDLSGKTIVWTIVDVDGTGVATIPAGSNGTSVVITAVAEGTARLTCTVGDATATCEITVTAGAVVEQPPVDVSGQLYQQEVYGEYYIGIRLECDADMGSKIASVEATATMDGEPTTARVHNVYGTNPKYVQIQVYQDWTHTYVFTLNYKNAAGKTIATGTFTKAPEKSIKLNVSTLNLELGVTDEGTVTATLTGNPSGEIAWSIDGDNKIATIQVSPDKMSVTVTAVGAGTATITASIDSMTATCKVVVVEEGDTPTDPIVTQCRIMEVYGGDVHVGLLLEAADDLASIYAEVASKMAYVKVNGVKNNDMKDMFAYGAGGDYRVNVYMGGPVQKGVDYVFEICDADGNVLLKTVAVQWN